MQAICTISSEVLIIEIPAFYQQLLSGPGAATLSVCSRDGSIQSTLVWPDFDGECIRLSMVAGSPKEANIRREKKATLLMSHAGNENMYISLRCELHEITQTGAIEHLNMITLRNMNVSRWYGEVEPEDSPSKDKTVLVYLRPVRVYHA